MWRDIAPDARSGFNSVSDFFSVGLNIMLGITIAVSLITIILSGIKIIMAKGDPKALAEAKSALTYSILGFILGIGAFTLKLIIFNMLGGDFGKLKDATPGF